MRHGQPRLVELRVREEEQVEVDRPRAEPRPLAGPAEPLLDGEERVEEAARVELRLHRRRRVEEARLVDLADRLRFAKGRNGDDPYAGRRVERRERGPHRRLAIAEVRADPDVRHVHRSDVNALGVACVP